ncbi:hypothetical protein DYBT9623_04465 [Dyadobacter sp. CECT 9623]|uniref:XRE family transcriptional regulator n=1 Tax=Dyadobacter linearis TaxID=2823330 RepID=A0ABM8UVU6_9BACT|nr:hypothetical protein DYBT9623_04465 [Dyadobacter sp. CECT 9623]
MNSKFLNVTRIKKLKELRDKLPSRCSFAQTISQKLNDQGVNIKSEQIYQMVRGHRTVNEKVLEEMQKLVTEFEDSEVAA